MLATDAKQLWVAMSTAHTYFAEHQIESRLHAIVNEMAATRPQDVLGWLVQRLRHEASGVSSAGTVPLMDARKGAAAFGDDLAKTWDFNLGLQQPGKAPPPAPATAKPSQKEPAAADKGATAAEVAEQGQIVRQLKADKAPKAEIDAAVAYLKALKAAVQAKGAAPAAPPQAKAAAQKASSDGELELDICGLGSGVLLTVCEKGRS